MGKDRPAAGEVIVGIGIYKPADWPMGWARDCGNPGEVSERGIFGVEWAVICHGSD